MTHVLIPFAAFPLASAMRAVDERVLLAARGLGASRLRIFWSVFLPMTASGVIGAALIVFVFTLGFFVTPAILGGGRSIMVAELVYLRMFQSPDWGLGAAVSVTLVLIVGAADGGAVPSGPARHARRRAMIQRPSPIALALAALVAAFLLAPLLAVVPISLTPARFLTMPNGRIVVDPLSRADRQSGLGRGAFCSACASASSAA